MAGPQIIHGCPLLERIGEGGIADVFRSEWEGRPVALKVLRDPERVSVARRFIREGRLLQRLQHVGLVRCLAIFEGDTPTLVLELLRGSPLDERVARRPLSGDEAMHLGAAVLRTLQHLHEHGVVHRDVNASNIFCTDDNRTILMDLGLAADVADPLATTLGDVLGTYAYMAPEQIAGALSDHRCDLYSLGVTLYEAVCGARPYNARSAAAWLAAHRSGEATPLGEVASGLPVRFASLVDRLMARDPAVRPPSAAVALALLTGASGMRFSLHSPVLAGRGGALGAVSAVLDVGGCLQLVGPPGSGFGALARRIRQLAAESSVEVIGLRGRRRMKADDVRSVLAFELARFGLPMAQDVDTAVTLIEDLAREGVVLILAEQVDELRPEAFAVLARASGVLGVAAVHLGTEVPPVAGARRLPLRPLRVEEARGLAEGMLASRAVPAGFERAITEAAGGLPALVVGLIREQVEAGALRCEGVRGGGQPVWTWDASSGIVPGENTRRMLERSLRGLTEGARNALEVLAVADDSLPMELLEEASGGLEDGLTVGQLVARGLVETWSEGGDTWVRVARAGIERMVVERVDPEQRVRIHGALADAAAARGNGDWERRFQLVHRSLGVPGGEGVVALLELGEFLAQSGRPVRALPLFDQTAGAVDTLPPDLLPRRAFGRAEALVTLGRLSEALSALAAGVQLARGLSELAASAGVDPLEIEILLALGSPPSGPLVERVSARVNDGDARVLLALGLLATSRGQLATGKTLLSVAIESASSRIDRVGVRAAIALSEVYLLLGESAEAESVIGGVVRELRGLDRPTLLHAATLAAAKVQRALGQLGRASEILRSEGEGRRERFGASAMGIDVLTAAIALGTGDPEAAGRALARVGSTVGSVTYAVRADYYEVLAELRRVQNDGPAALAAHLVGAEAARAADDALRLAYHEAMAALRSVNAALTADAVGRLSAIGAPRHLAQVYLVGGLLGRDADILTSAEESARAAQDPLLLLEVLFARRSSAGRAEARAIARSVLAGLQGAARDDFQDRPEVAWALATPDRAAGGARDTRA